MSVMATLRKKCKKINYNRWGVHYWALGPDAVIQKNEASSRTVELPEGDVLLKTLQINYITVDISQETSEDVVMPNPQITIASDDLSPSPVAGEKWFFYVPESSVEDAPMKWFQASGDLLYPDGVLGTLTLKLIEAVHVPLPEEPVVP